jgi:hypothetical protein
MDDAPLFVSQFERARDDLAGHRRAAMIRITLPSVG